VPACAKTPDSHSIEEAEARLRASAARTWDALVQSVGPALQAITPTDALDWFCHCEDMCVLSISVKALCNAAFIAVRSLESTRPCRPPPILQHWHHQGQVD